MNSYGYFYRPVLQDYCIDKTEYYDLTCVDDYEPCNPCYPQMPIQYGCCLPSPSQLCTYGFNINTPPNTYNYAPCQETICCDLSPLPCVSTKQVEKPASAYAERMQCLTTQCCSTSCASEPKFEPVVLPTIYRRYPRRRSSQKELIAEFVDVIENCRPRRVYTKTFSRCESAPETSRYRPRRKICHEKIVRKPKCVTPTLKTCTQTQYVSNECQPKVTTLPPKDCIAPPVFINHQSYKPPTPKVQTRYCTGAATTEHVYENEKTFNEAITKYGLPKSTRSPTQAYNTNADLTAYQTNVSTVYQQSNQNNINFQHQHPNYDQTYNQEPYSYGFDHQAQNYGFDHQAQPQAQNYGFDHQGQPQAQNYDPQYQKYEQTRSSGVATLS